MKLRNPRSYVIIFIYLFVNVAVIVTALNQRAQESNSSKATSSLAPEYTRIEGLNYFHLKNSLPSMSLKADHMRSQGEEIAEFTEPRGIYNYDEKNKTLNYQDQEAHYQKSKDLLILSGKVRLSSVEALYLADKIKYFFKRDTIFAKGNVHFEGNDLKTKDHLEIDSESMKAKTKIQRMTFKGGVKGSLQRKKKYEGKMIFSSQQLDFDGVKSLANLEGGVSLSRQSYLITAGKADIFLENFNKSLKYFVFNDDVKVTETIDGPQGKTYRKAFSERLEGFGREEKMVLSGAPRVENGEDVVKGYRITIREKMELIEVDDAISDVKVRKDEKKKN